MKAICGVSMLALVLAACQAGDQSASEVHDERWTNHGGVQFSIDLYKGMSQGRHDQNFLISPASARAALAMTAEGARGQTQAEMLSAISLSPEESTRHREMTTLTSYLNVDPEQSDFSLANANRIWPEQSLNLSADFVRMTKDVFDSDVETLNFIQDFEPSRLTINDWVEEKTHEKIKDLLPPGSITRDTRVVLTNAVYFQADWVTKFDPDDTVEDNFYPTPTTETSATYMVAPQLLARGTDVADWDARILELPYVASEDSQSSVSMLVILPNRIDGLAELIDRIDTETLAEQAALSSISPLLLFDVKLPKWELTSDVMTLVPTLRSLGMNAAFSGHAADFSGMLAAGGSRPRLAISDVLQKTFIAVDEEGTEAAGATAVIVSETSVPPSGGTFHVDRPFLYAIRENTTGTILFLGHVVEP